MGQGTKHRPINLGRRRTVFAGTSARAFLSSPSRSRIGSFRYTSRDEYDNHARCAPNFAFAGIDAHPRHEARWHALDRKSTRLNSSHVAISYAVFCLKKKK